MIKWQILGFYDLIKCKDEIEDSGDLLSALNFPGKYFRYQYN